MSNGNEVLAGWQRHRQDEEGINRPRRPVHTGVLILRA